MSTVAPGWYKDPADPTTQRWWDGEGWLGEPIPADAIPPEGPPAVLLTPPPVTTPAPLPGQPPFAGPAPWPGTPGQPGQVIQPGSSPVPGAPPAGWPMSHRYPLAAPRPHGYLVAGAGSRFMARVVDVLMVLILAGIANAWFAIKFWHALEPFWNWWLSQPMNSTPDLSTAPPLALAEQYLVLMFVVLTAVWFAYEVPATANSGQTLGKRIFGIRIVRMEANERLGFGRSFWRWFRLAWPTPFWIACWGLPALLQFVDCLFIVTDRQLHRALHDRVTNTVVIQVPRASRPETAQLLVDPAAAPGGPRADAR